MAAKTTKPISPDCLIKEVFADKQALALCNQKIELIKLFLRER